MRCAPISRRLCRQCWRVTRTSPWPMGRLWLQHGAPENGNGGIALNAMRAGEQRSAEVLYLSAYGYQRAVSLVLSRMEDLARRSQQSPGSRVADASRLHAPGQMMTR